MDYIKLTNKILKKLSSNGYKYEYMSIKNEFVSNCNSTEIIGEVGSILDKMKEKKEINNVIGKDIDLYKKQANKLGIYYSKSNFYTLEEKEFVIDGNNFSNLKEFYNEIGSKLVKNNNWGKNWAAFNDILRGGFIITEYLEPFILIWKNSHESKSKLKEYNEIVDLIKSHDHIELRIS